MCAYTAKFHVQALCRGDSKMPGYDNSYVHIFRLPLTYFTFIHFLAHPEYFPCSMQFPLSLTQHDLYDDFSSISSVYVISFANRGISLFCSFVYRKKNFLQMENFQLLRMRMWKRTEDDFMLHACHDCSFMIFSSSRKSQQSRW